MSCGYGYSYHHFIISVLNPEIGYHHRFFFDHHKFVGACFPNLFGRCLARILFQSEGILDNTSADYRIACIEYNRLTGRDRHLRFFENYSDFVLVMRKNSCRGFIVS